MDDQTSTKSSENDTMSDYYTEPENDPNDETVSWNLQWNCNLLWFYCNLAFIQQSFTYLVSLFF